MKQSVVWTVFLIAASCPALAAEADNIVKVKQAWRAESGETAEQIFAKVSKVAHFVPRGWEVGQKTDVGKPVIFSWAKHRADKPSATVEKAIAPRASGGLRPCKLLGPTRISLALSGQHDQTTSWARRWQCA